MVGINKKLQVEWVSFRNAATDDEYNLLGLARRSLKFDFVSRDTEILVHFYLLNQSSREMMHILLFRTCKICIQ